MKNKIVAGLILTLVLFLAGAASLPGQEGLKAPAPPSPPEVAPPEVPEIPEPPEPPAPPEDLALGMVTGEGNAWLGITLSEVTAEKAKELKLPGEYGAVIERVQEDSPAAKAGLAQGDVIVSFAGERIRSVAQLRRMVRETPAGRTVTLEVSRNGQTRSVSVKTGTARERAGAWGFAMPKMDIRIPHFEMPQFDVNVLVRGALLGISGEDLTSQLAQYFGVKQGGGVLVREVMPGSAAEKAGLKAGDVIVRVDQAEVKTLGDLRRALPHDFDAKRKVALGIVRNRQEQAVSVELEPTERQLHPRIVGSDRVVISPEEISKVQTEILRQRLQYQKLAQEATREVLRKTQQQQEQLKRYLDLQKQQIKLRKYEIIRHKAPAAIVAPGDLV